MKFKNCLIAAVLVASATAVMAQEKVATPYASIRYFIGAYYQDKDFNANGKDVDMVNSLMSTSRLGMRFKNGNVTGQVELALGPGHVGSTGVRQAWGAYTFDMGLTILAGNTDSPWYKPVSSEAWDIYGGPGSAQGNRGPRIKLSFMGVGSEKSFVYLDLAKAPNPGGPTNGIGDPFYAGQDVYMPLTTIGYEYKSDMADIGVGVTGYNYFIKNHSVASGPGGYPEPTKDNFLAYMAFINGTVKLGGPYVKFNFAYEKAPQLLGLADWYNPNAHFNAAAHQTKISADLEKYDDAFIEGLVEFGYKTPEFGASIAVGYMSNISNGDAYRMAYGLNIEIPVAPGFRVVPTVFYLDEGKDTAKNKQGADCLALIKFQLDL